MVQLGDIDRSDPRPPYQQIAGMLRSAIESGTLEPGARLPSEAALMENFGVARMTARQAIQELRGEGLVIPEHGRGVFVRPMPPVRRLASDRFARRHRDAGKAAFIAEADKAGYQPGVDRIEISRTTATETIAERLRLPAGDEVLVRDRRYLANGRPVEVATSYLPIAIADGTPIEEPDPGPGGIYARLEEAGHTLARFSEEVGARMPTPDERTALEIGPGIPVLTVVRTAYDVNDLAVEVCDTVKVAPAYLLEYDVPAQ
ncbi:GntR family transcriptional regulator [Prauserella alba]|uniref:GntR family transcriptional regulator n=1 Tax=Prauserella alba TaxID=176898 RepID=A0ABP4G8K3_9PSEU|nr:GntR family transcriptional regulator [Prauserella alba]MCP2181976.1 GntR family transcriptional regulator [Prauserella alba]